MRTGLRAGGRGGERRGLVYDDRAAPRASEIPVPITMDAQGRQELVPAVDSIREQVGGGEGGLAVHVTGPGGTTARGR